MSSVPFLEGVQESQQGRGNKRTGKKEEGSRKQGEAKKVRRRWVGKRDSRMARGRVKEEE